MLDRQGINMDKSEGKYIYVLYLLYPVLSLWMVFKNYRASWAKNVVWLFTIFYGFTFYISSDSAADAVRYKDMLVEMGRSNLDFQSFFNLLFSESSSYIDIAQPLLTFLVSRFTLDHRFLFAAFGFFYGYLYSRNIWFLIEQGKTEVQFMNRFLLVFFAFLVGISAMNGIRFWMATHLFFFGTISLVFEQKKKGFWIAASAILVHFSFLLPLVLLLGYRIIGNHRKVYACLFFCSFFVAVLNLNYLNQFSGYLPKVLQAKSNTYLNEDYVQKVAEEKSEKSWFIPLINEGVSYALVLLVGMVLWHHQIYLLDPRVLRVFCVALLFYGVFNILSVLPSMGRFLSLSRLLLVAGIYWASISWEEGPLRQVLIFCLPFLFLFVLFQFRIMMGYSSYLLVFSNPLLSLFMHPDAGILELLMK